MKTKSIVILAVASALLGALSLFAGPTPINPFTLLSDSLSSEIIFSIRLPRTLVAIAVGAALGASGAVLQGVLRNPLADPYILGISSGAALLAGSALALGVPAMLGMLGTLTIPALAFTGALGTSLLVGALGTRRGHVAPERLLLAGIGLGFLFTAMLLLMLSLSPEQGLRRAMLWLFGDLSLADFTLFPVGVIIIIIGISIALSRTRALNALMLGDEVAHSLGFTPSRERMILFIAASLMTAAAVTLGGIIGFIGLLIPHLVRFSVGADAKLVVPLAAVVGGAVLCAADTIGRSVLAPTEIPSGIITALIGAPFFLYLLRKKEVLSS